MQNEQQNKTEYGLWIDFPFFFRTLKRWLFAFMALAVAAGCLTYVGADMVLQDTYTASGLVSVVPKSNETSAAATSSINTAMSRDVNMWNSSALIKEIQDSNPDRAVSGSLSASSVENTSLVRLTATASTAQDAYYLLSSAMRSYHQIESSFDEKYVGVVLTGTSGNIISVDYAHPIKFAALAFGVVLLGFFGVLFIWCCVTNVLHQETQASELLAASLYESLPHINKKRQNLKSVLITQSNCDMDYLEAMDKLTSRVEQHMKSEGQKILLVTSIQENEGKSTVSVNLALNLARRGRKTLLIDLDFRKPALYKMLNIEKRDSGSFSEVLRKYPGMKAEPETLEDTYGLQILWQFKGVHDPDRLLDHASFRQVLDELARSYEYVILDMPPMAPVRDSEVASQAADCSLLVIRQDYSRAAVANDVIDQLEEHGAPCIGAVLNNCRAYRRTGSKAKGNRYAYNYRTAKGE